MVLLSRYLLAQHGKRVKRKHDFIDKLRIYARGGTGGQGYPTYGGIGGDGGNIYLEASSKMTFRKLRNKNPSKRFVAEHGKNSRFRSLQGSRGSDIFVPIPLGVCVTDDNKNMLGDINSVGQRLLVAKGGRGGCAESDWKGLAGEKICLNLELKLIADVGFVGFPNAGKSTLLKALSRTEPRIAEYPFTTIRPQLGICEYADLRQISLADLPGLVEGAHYNVGMGHKFLRHVERTKLLLFVVDVHGFRLSTRHPFRTAFQTVMLLNKELELYKEEVVQKPAILALNKLDVEGAEAHMEETLEMLKNVDKQADSIMPSDKDEDIRPDNLIDFRDTICISAKEGRGVDELKARIRDVIDEEAEKERDSLEEKEKVGR